MLNVLRGNAKEFCTVTFQGLSTKHSAVANCFLNNLKHNFGCSTLFNHVLKSFVQLNVILCVFVSVRAHTSCRLIIDPGGPGGPGGPGILSPSTPRSPFKTQNRELLVLYQYKNVHNG